MLEIAPERAAVADIVEDTRRDDGRVDGADLSIGSCGGHEAEERLKQVKRSVSLMLAAQEVVWPVSRDRVAPRHGRVAQCKVRQSPGHCRIERQTFPVREAEKKPL